MGYQDVRIAKIERAIFDLKVFAAGLAMLVTGIGFKLIQVDSALKLGHHAAIEAKRGAAEIVNPHKRGRDVNE